MFKDSELWIGLAENASGDHVSIVPKMANRHGIIAGATGTGKTITLKVLAESFSDCGVPVFLADAKGDLAGMCEPGTDTEDMQKRIQKYGLEGFTYTAYPTCLWDIYGKGGHPLRTTISEMGPTLLARLLGLNDTQTDVLSIVFRIADDNQMLLLDLKDLRSMLEYIAIDPSRFSAGYGNITKQTVGAISRSLVRLEDEGGRQFFGEPALDLKDWMRLSESGKGYINVLDCTKLINSPVLYSTFLLWMISELFEMLPEAGDMEKPKMVFFFDEAHMLFNDAPKALLDKIEQTVKLIRSKGVGIYFITQSPADIPDEVLSQLGNRVQHALRAYTPADQKAVKAAARSFRVNPDFDTGQVITELGVGEALISFLDENGVPGMVQKCHVLPPQSHMGAITDEQRRTCMMKDPCGPKYDTMVDRESAFELLQKRFQEEEAKERAEEEAKEQAKQEAKEEREREKEEREALREKKEREREEDRAARKREKMLAPITKTITTMFSTVGREVGRDFVRGLLGNLKKK